MHLALSACPLCCTPRLQYKQYKLIYRRYANLYFIMCVDPTDNELAYLEAIHLFVELLDHYFHSVCELDLVFNFHKVRGGLRQCLGRWLRFRWTCRICVRWSVYVGSVCSI